ncbi:phage gp6-like head-tail connector protein [Staphylococcus pseudintermedius]|nr:phage gp6-like head-tail connector protein [Staphylococcus pseudintermedius]EHT6216313.1 phage gp6-like head-tail connector protein [Staphylococcus pseudintermedius]MDK3896830.1 phage gp6-like head-tail connector protein [Staphylococcus pseudintermedius]HBJ9576508.1 phage gp6-like head-tail connector protein [Staphylococcus pseudintermedius]
MISDDILRQFKSRMHIFHSAEDERLRNDLQISYEILQRDYGEFDIFTNIMGKELVFERTRYVYNEQLQYFLKNFSTELVNFGLENVVMKEDFDGADKL